MKLRFTKLNGDCAGDYGDGVARIDLSKDYNPGSTAVHEAIHHLYPELPEKKVRLWERKIWRNLPYTKKLDVYRQLINRRTNLIIRIVKETIG